MKWKIPFFNKSRTREKSNPETSAPIFLKSGGEVVTPITAMKVSAFYRGVTYVSSQVSKLPWNLKDKENNYLEDNSINKLIELSPNKEMSSMFFRMLLIQQALIHGNGYAEIERDGIGRPIALWPIKSTRVSGERDKETGELWYKVSASNLNEETVYLRRKDVFHISNIHTIDGIFGQGLVYFASQILGIGLGADRFANSLFANGGLPSGYLKVDGTLSDDGKKRLKEQWQKNYGGRKVGGTALLEDGITYESISMDPTVLQFLETRQFNVKEIARYLGVPPTKLFDTEATTYNNVENANLEVIVDTLDTWTKIFEFEADRKLLNDRFGGRKTEMDLFQVFRGDMGTRGKYYSDMMQNGAITSNEIRLKEGFAPYPEGDKFYIASNNLTPTDRVDDVIDSQITKPEIKEVSENESYNEQEEEEEDLDSLVTDYIKERLR